MERTCGSQSSSQSKLESLSHRVSDKCKHEFSANGRQASGRPLGGKRRDRRQFAQQNGKWLSNCDRQTDRQTSDASDTRQWRSRSKACDDAVDGRPDLNELLNFKYESRQLSAHRQHYGRDKGWSGRSGQRVVKYNKEHFIQANCQFVVSHGYDYSIHSSDPDVSVDWNLVEQIMFNCLANQTVCPICLHSPIAAKITRCGHIYCWSCFLHYLALSDNKWRKCPICFDAIQKDDLRSVSFLLKDDFKVGDQITMRLMKRKKGTTVAIPVRNQNDEIDEQNRLIQDPICDYYQKIFIAPPLQVLQCIIARERQQLLQQMSEEKDTPEVCFIESALKLLDEREAKLTLKCNTKAHDVNENSTDEKKTKSQAIAIDSNEEFYHFYQCSDGQHIYLHNLNARMLRKQYGSLERSPLLMRCKILEMEWCSMNVELRKRYKYLQHLPLTCAFKTVELEFDTNLLSEQTLNMFNDEVIHRQRVRNNREREERKRERHIQVEQNKIIYGKYPLPKYQLNNYQQFPSYEQNNDNLPHSPTPSTDSSLVEDNALQNDNLSICSGSSPTAEPEFRSFAAMLREGKAKTQIQETKQNKDSDNEYQPPDHHYSISDAFEAALELRDNNQKTNVDKRGKKKKNKAKVLMSTCMKRSY